MLHPNHRLVLQLIEEELADSSISTEVPLERASGMIFSEMVRLSGSTDPETQLDRFVAIAAAAVRAAATVAGEETEGGLS